MRISDWSSDVCSSDLKIHVIDLNPNSPTYHQIIRTDPLMTIDVAITAADGQQYGHVTSMALNADGTRLYATVPVSEMYGPNGWVWQGNTTPGEVIVINVDERERPAPGARSEERLVGREGVGRYRCGGWPYT